jgi:hypothetical protein
MYRTAARANRTGNGGRESIIIPRVVWRCAVTAVTLAASWCSQSASAAGAVTTPDDFYPIAVWSQPIVNFDRWKARGVNTLMKYEPYGGAPGNDIDSWAKAAAARSLYQIRQAKANPADDLNDSKLLAWMQDDEPDYRNHDPAVLAQKFAAWKAVDPNKPVLVNFSGGNVLTGATSRAQYEQFMNSANWIGNDFYPVTGWNRPDWIDYSLTPADRKTPGQAIQQLSQWSDGKPQWSIIETSDQDLSFQPNARGATRDEFRGEVWHSIINGAQGIVYFPFRIGGAGFSFDKTPTDVIDEMTTQNARIKSLARVLNSADSPTTAKLDLGNSLLEAARRSYDGDDYFFVLNMSSKTLDDLSVQLPGLGKLPNVDVVGEAGRTLGLSGGTLIDDFGPWEIHVYHADLSGYGLLPGQGTIGGAGGTIDEVPPPGGGVPEPGSVATLGVATLMVLRRRNSIRGT